MSSFSVIRQTQFFGIFKKNKKKKWRRFIFFGLKLILLILKMSIITAFPGIKRSVVYRFCFLPFLDLFVMKLTITISAMLSLCRFGDHVLFSGSTVMTLLFQGSYSQISYDFFFSPHQLTHPKPGNLFNAK